MISRTKHEQIVLARGCIVAVALSLAVVRGVPAAATGSQWSPSSSPRTMDRETEVDLALSACPASVAKGAGVYVLGEHGYVKARDSKNGFTAIVTRLTPKAQGPQSLGPDGNPAGPVFVAGEGTPHALIIVPLGSHSGVAHAGAENPGGP